MSRDRSTNFVATPLHADFIPSLQQPIQQILWIGCSDSCFQETTVLNLLPDEMLVHRNMGNMLIDGDLSCETTVNNSVPNVDLNVMSVINYAVRHLHVKHIIVCGHYNCGGVKAALTSADLGILNPWLRNVRDIYRLHEKELDQITDDDMRYNRLIELNVIESCRNMIKTAAVQQRYCDGQRLHRPAHDLISWNAAVATANVASHSQLSMNSHSAGEALLLHLQIIWCLPSGKLFEESRLCARFGSNPVPILLEYAIKRLP